MSFPCIVQVLCMTWYIQVNLVKILVTSVSRINRQEEYCLSFARILTSKYSSRVDDSMKIERTSNMVSVLEELLGITTLSCKKGSIRLRPECPSRAWKNNLFLNHKYSTGISSLLLLLLPNMLSIDRQINE